MILCCGEALIDMIPAPLSDGTMGFQAHSGGSVFNTAIGLGRLGADVALLTALGRDQFGEKLLSELKASHVSCQSLHYSSNPTPLAFAHICAEDVSYQFYQQGCADLADAFADLQDPASNLVGDVKAAFFGGISLCNGHSADVYEALAKQLAATAFLMLDPNIRPAFIKDEPRYRKRLQDLMAIADVVKISEEDMNWLAPDYNGYYNRLKWLRAQCKGRVIVTRGDVGAYLYGPHDLEIYAPAPSVDLVDPIGAGDSFNSGFLAMMQEQDLLRRGALDQMSFEQRGYALQRALSFAVKIASLSVQKAGANPPWRSEL